MKSTCYRVQFGVFFPFSDNVFSNSIYQLERLFNMSWQNFRQKFEWTEYYTNVIKINENNLSFFSVNYVDAILSWFCFAGWQLHFEPMSSIRWRFSMSCRRWLWVWLRSLESFLGLPLPNLHGVFGWSWSLHAMSDQRHPNIFEMIKSQNLITKYSLGDRYR